MDNETVRLIDAHMLINWFGVRDELSMDLRLTTPHRE